MTSNDAPFPIHQDGDVEAEGFDASGNLADLLGGMGPGIPRIRPQIVDLAIRQVELGWGGGVSHWGLFRKGAQIAAR
jgi:hypothetical protein